MSKTSRNKNKKVETNNLRERNILIRILCANHYYKKEKTFNFVYSTGRSKESYSIWIVKNAKKKRMLNYTRKIKEAYKITEFNTSASVTHSLRQNSEKIQIFKQKS